VGQVKTASNAVLAYLSYLSYPFLKKKKKKIISIRIGIWGDR